MMEKQIIFTEHKDVVHDISYDYYGARFATCSSDQTIKIFEVKMFVLSFFNYF